MRADSDKAALATEVLVELVLEVDEGLVLELVEGAGEAEDGSGEEGAERRGRGLDVALEQLGGLSERVRRRRLLLEENAERARQALDAEQVVAGAVSASKQITVPTGWQGSQS